MAHAKAIGLEDEGGVTRGSNANLDIQGNRSHRSRGTADLAYALQAANAGPSMRTQVAGKLNQASAQGAGAQRGADYDQQKVQAERLTVQAHNDSTQAQAPNAALADTTFGSLNRPV